ncbi:hypothetical protein [Streptomyces sp. NPDC026673]|uniref:hypothetical protein n=1 Tax=Streptomyces sp. NPDC026673 TaxID=3155724 RepID=UPI0033CFD90C
MNADPGSGETGWPLNDAFRLVRAEVPDLVVERAAGGERDDADFLLRIAGSIEAVEVECRPGGQPVFIVSDEYSWIEAADPAAAAQAILDLLRA